MGPDDFAPDDYAKAQAERQARREAAASLDAKALSRLWMIANAVGFAAFAIIGSWILGASSGDGELLFLAIVIGGAFGYLARCAAVYTLGSWRAPGLAAFIVETEMNRQGDALTVDTKHHETGDERLDGYIKSYVEARERIFKIGGWVMVLVFFSLIMLIANAFGLVDIVW